MGDQTSPPSSTSKETVAGDPFDATQEVPVKELSEMSLDEVRQYAKECGASLREAQAEVREAEDLYNEVSRFQAQMTSGKPSLQFLNAVQKRITRVEDKRRDKQRSAMRVLGLQKKRRQAAHPDDVEK